MFMAENFTAKSFVTNSFAADSFTASSLTWPPLLEIDFFDVSDDFEQEKITFFGTKNLLKL